MLMDNPIITNSHVNAYNFLILNQENIKKKILNALLIEYPNLILDCEFEIEAGKENIHEITNINQFNELIGLSNIHILNIYQEDTAYVGYEFGCNWGEEHELGILTHKERIIEIGRADSSFLTWIAEKDLNSEE
jgi:hypothetical protein